jgi:SAM-dependent methyltransferase
VVSFTCNICGYYNEVEDFATEPATCACGSNVRLRALMHLLSMELFGSSLIVAQFPTLKAIRGLGLSDQSGYARILTEKFDYTNTFYDREPRFDIAEAHPRLAGAYDFILLADVLEHIAPPLECALAETCRLLKPHGFLGITVFCNAIDEMREHFPELNEFRIVQLGDSQVLVHRRRDGSLEVRDDLIFHGGSGATLEMREFGMTALQNKLLQAGFRQIFFLTEDLPVNGILFDHDVSQPLIARKEPFAMDRCAAGELAEQYCAAREQSERQQMRAGVLAEQVRMAEQSRWLRLGRKLGLGPKFSVP